MRYSWLLLAALPGCLIDASSTFPETIESPCAQPVVCPPDMVSFIDDNDHEYAGGNLQIQGGRCLCIDRYEASRGPDGAATAREGAEPWTGISFEEATRACAAAGKRLCTAREWTSACAGLPAAPYPYGFEVREGLCNTTSTVTVSGAFSSCEGGWPGVFDMSGNVAEWTGDLDSSDSCSSEFGCAPHGGSFDSPPFTRACGYEVGFSRTSTSSKIGFRCCSDGQ